MSITPALGRRELKLPWLRVPVAMVNSGYSYRLLTTLHNWTAPTTPSQELLTCHFISKAFTSTYVFDLITIKVNIKRRNSFTLLQLEVIFQNLNEKKKQTETTQTLHDWEM